MRVSCQFVSVVALLAANSQSAPLDLPLSGVNTNVGATTSTANLVAATNGTATNLGATTNGTDANLGINGTTSNLGVSTHGIHDTLGATTGGLTSKLGSITSGVTHKLPSVHSLNPVDTSVGATTSAANLGTTTSGTSTDLKTSTHGIDNTLGATTSGLTSTLGATTSGVTHKLHSLHPSARVSNSLFGRSPRTIAQAVSEKDGLNANVLDSIFSGLNLKVEKRGLASPFGVLQNFAQNVPGAGAVSSLPVAGSVLPSTGSLMSNNPVANAIPSFSSTP